MNKDNKSNGFLVITNLIFSEAHIGHSRLDKHFSYLNIIINSFLEDDNYSVLENHMINAIKFRGGITGATRGFLDVPRL